MSKTKSFKQLSFVLFLIVAISALLAACGDTATPVATTTAATTAATTTTAGLTVKSKLDTNVYPAGVRVSDQQMAELQLRRDRFHGDWNYSLLPRN